MAQYNKAIIALVAAVVGFLASLGITVPDSISTFVESSVPFVSAVLVYFVPNRIADSS